VEDPDDRPIRPASASLVGGDSAEATRLSELPWLAKFGGMQLNESFDNGGLFDTDPSHAEKQESLDALLSDLKQFTSTPKYGGKGGFDEAESTGMPSEITGQPGSGTLHPDLDDGWSLAENPFGGPDDGFNPAASDSWGGAHLCQSSGPPQDPTLLIPC